MNPQDFSLVINLILFINTVIVIGFAFGLWLIKEKLLIRRKEKRDELIKDIIKQLRKKN